MANFFSSSFMLGVLGGGQLGKMLLHETSRQDIRTAVLDPSGESPCRRLADYFEIGDLSDFETVYRFGKLVNLLTIEIEHVNVEALEALEREGLPVFPSSKVLRTIQNKQVQKDFYQSHGIPTATYFHFNSKAEIQGKELSFPCVWKSATGGYDGKGVAILQSQADWDSIPDVPGLIEAFVANAKEIAVMVARSPSGETAAFPAVEMEFHPTANLVEFLFSPSSLSPEAETLAQAIAMDVANAIELVGVMAVEMFVAPDGRILVNESAPRPHNSGHHTIESAFSSQYDQHLRAILDLPLGSTRPRSAAVMVNLLGEPGHSGHVCYNGIEDVLKMEGVFVHVYGKKQTRPFRKMGHVTILADELQQAKEKARIVKQILKVESCKAH